MKAAAVPTVFIIDDDRGMRQAVQDLVESVGLRAESFATGGEFLSRATHHRPELPGSGCKAAANEWPRFPASV